MNKTIIYLLTMYSFCFHGSAQSGEKQKTFSERNEKVIEVLKRHVENGLPGVAVAYYSPQEGEWTHSEGFSNIEKKEPLTNAHLHYLQSVSKTYMAVVILKLFEQGKINLDDDISKYLSRSSIGNLANKGITVKMLLNHTSGIPDYVSSPAYLKFVMGNLYSHCDVQEFIDFIKNDPLDFEPASDYSYSNTNYVLLSMIGDKITGDHIAFMDKVIFAPLKLEETFYLTQKNYLSIPNIVSSYWDVLNVEKPIDVTTIQKVNVSSLRGDDGLVCSTQDAIKFLRGLVEGKLLKKSTMELMQQWVIKDGAKRYGLGLIHYDLGETFGIGHSGGGLGAGCFLMYLPEKDAYIFVAINFNTLIDGKIIEKCANIQQDILSALLF